MGERTAMSSADLLTALDGRYPTDRGWLHVEEAGGAFGRRVDRVSMNLWASRGFQLLGFELKVTRGDWLRELKQPQKADQSLFRFLDEWWVITAPGVIAEVEEVPVTWGWAEVVGGRLKTRKKAPRLTPLPITRAVLATICTRLVARDAMRERLADDAIHQKANERAEQYAAAKIERLEREKADLEDTVKRLRPLRGWAHPELEQRYLEVAKTLFAGDWSAAHTVLSNSLTNAQRAVVALEQAKSQLAALRPEHEAEEVAS